MVRQITCMNFLFSFTTDKFSIMRPSDQLFPLPSSNISLPHVLVIHRRCLTSRQKLNSSLYLLWFSDGRSMCVEGRALHLLQ